MRLVRAARWLRGLAWLGAAACLAVTVIGVCGGHAGLAAGVALHTDGLPWAWAAAMALLNATPVSGDGRRIAVLGDMLELGEHSAKLHAALADLIVGTETRTVFLGGPEMRALAEILPAEIRTEYRAGAEDLKPVLLSALKPGDVVMVKSSKGIGFAKLVDALLGKFPAQSTTNKQT